MPDTFITFATYQETAAETAIYPEEASVVYPALGLANEAGEVLGKIKKAIRDGISDPETFQQQIGAEIGDVLWYLAALASDLNLNLADIAQANLDKLNDRARRGVIGGSGDTR